MRTTLQNFTNLSAMAAVLIAGTAVSVADEVSLAVIEIYGSPAEVEVGYSWLGDGSDSLLGIISTIDTLAYDDEFSGLVIRLKDSALSSTQVEEIGAAMLRGFRIKMILTMREIN